MLFWETNNLIFTDYSHVFQQVKEGEKWTLLVGNRVAHLGA